MDLIKKIKQEDDFIFGLANLKGDKKIIKDLKLNKKKQTFEFRYKGHFGRCENAKNGEIKVNDIWKIIFISETEFDKMENL